MGQDHLTFFLVIITYALLFRNLFGTSALADVPIGVIILSKKHSTSLSVKDRLPFFSSIFLATCKITIDNYINLSVFDKQWKKLQINSFL